ncbi:hypothetical protein ABEW34_01860 [Paenibacillus algorifonticola]|uniref:hypothetical protein n=1 Tax=Paenibacillus algorifonticola TaxID=684063 RepID=UPI003D271026
MNKENQRIAELNDLRTPQNAHLIDAAIKLGSTPEQAATAIFKEGAYEGSLINRTKEVVAEINAIKARLGDKRVYESSGDLAEDEQILYAHQLTAKGR